jgi:hypothetical protein
MQKGHNGVFWDVLLLVMGRAKEVERESGVLSVNLQMRV